jgi:hypothetical protein
VAKAPGIETSGLHALFNLLSPDFDGVFQGGDTQWYLPVTVMTNGEEILYHFERLLTKPRYNSEGENIPPKSYLFREMYRTEKHAKYPHEMKSAREVLDAKCRDKWVGMVNGEMLAKDVMSIAPTQIW